MRIGIIGAGNLGRALARRLGAAGQEVMLSFKRDGEALQDLAARLSVGAGAPAEAVRFAEVVVLAVPWPQVRPALAAAGSLNGTILWDCTNALAPDLSGLVIGTTTSAGEEIAAMATGARVVKAIPPFAELLAGDQSAWAPKPAVFLCSDDAAAKAVVAPLIAAIGAEAVDAGPLRAARYTEPAGMLLVQLAYGKGLGGQIGISLTRYPSA